MVFTRLGRKLLHDAYERVCTLPCCWPPHHRPKVHIRKDPVTGLWHWKIPRESQYTRPLAKGTAFDWAHALSNGLHALDHLTETIVRAH